jgi:protein-tyrosine phosphatase
MKRYDIPSSPPPKVAPAPGMDRLLFVCDGNICRSAVALEFVRRHQVAGHLPHCQAESAGLVAQPGDIPMQETLVAAQAAGIDLAAHRARPLSASEQRLHLAFIMEERQRLPVMEATGLPAERVLMLGGFAAEANSAAILDPFGGSAATFTACIEQISAAVDGLVAWLDQDQGC